MHAYVCRKLWFWGSLTRFGKINVRVCNKKECRHVEHGAACVLATRMWLFVFCRLEIFQKKSWGKCQGFSAASHSEEGDNFPCILI